MNDRLQFKRDQDAVIEAFRVTYKKKSADYVRAVKVKSDVQVSALIEMVGAGNDYFRKCEESTLDHDGLSGDVFQIWLRDRIGSAESVLSGLPKYFQHVRRERGRLGLPSTMFEPSPGVFQNMQALLAAKRPESALKLKDEFGRCGLPLTGFDHPYEPTPSHLDGSGIGRQHDLDHTATHDKRAAMPLFYLIVSTFGLIALACIGGGIYAIHRSSYASTKFDFLGVHLESGSVGVALVVVGVVVAFFTVKAVLKKV